MGLLLGVCFAIFVSSVAQTQPLFTIEQMMETAIIQCVSQRGPGAQTFCNCWVRRWVGLWDANDRIVWTQTAQATPHMQQMEAVAASQCGGRP